MRTKFIAGITAAVITASGLGLTLAHATDGENHKERRMEHRVEHLTKELNLTTQQQADLKSQLLSQHEDQKHHSRKAVFKQLMQLDPNAADYQTQLDSLVLEAQEQTKNMIMEKAEAQEKLFEILTPEQEKSFIALKNEMGEKMSKRYSEGKRGHHSEKKCH
jgi:Spy/CpxP family protein refolding chaperone